MSSKLDSKKVVCLKTNQYRNKAQWQPHKSDQALDALGTGRAKPISRAPVGDRRAFFAGLRLVRNESGSLFAGLG